MPKPANVLITGMPTTGKTSLFEFLKGKQLPVIDGDHMITWQTKDGKPIDELRPKTTSRAWLEAHDLVFNNDFKAQLRSRQAPIIVCGMDYTLNEVNELFDFIILLYLSLIHI